MSHAPLLKSFNIVRSLEVVPRLESDVRHGIPQITRVRTYACLDVFGASARGPILPLWVSIRGRATAQGHGCGMAAAPKHSICGVFRRVVQRRVLLHINADLLFEENTRDLTAAIRIWQ